MLYQESDQGKVAVKRGEMQGSEGVYTGYVPVEPVFDEIAPF